MVSLVSFREETGTLEAAENCELNWEIDRCMEEAAMKYYVRRLFCAHHMPLNHSGS